MPWNPFPPTWKRLASNDQRCLEYVDSAALVFGSILALLAVSGLVGTTREMLRRWPDERSLFIGGLVFCVLMLAVALRLFVEHRVLISRTNGSILFTWHWLLWRGETKHDLAAFTSVSFAADQSIWPHAQDTFWRFCVNLTGPEGAALTLFWQQSRDDAQRLTQEIATFLGFGKEDDT